MYNTASDGPEKRTYVKDTIEQQNGQRLPLLYLVASIAVILHALSISCSLIVSLVIGC